MTLVFEDADNTTLVLGYQFAREIGVQGTASIELEIDEPKIPELVRQHLIQNGRRNLRAFYHYRTPGTVYFKTKIGLLSSRIETSTMELI